jgi:hypothetical protein
MFSGAWEQELEALDVKYPGAFPKRENVWGGLPEPAEEGAYSLEEGGFCFKPQHGSLCNS